MSKCNFTIDFMGSGEELIRSAEQAIAGAGGNFSGNGSDGTFTINTPLGTVAGSYTVTGQAFNISIIDKPFLLGCGRIEDELRKHIR